MSDALIVTVVFPDQTYPSKNHEGKDARRDGAKSDAYKWVFREVKKAAEQSIRDAKWTTAQGACLFVLTLIVPNRRRRDAINLGTAEANALTAAGVWHDDTLANPAIKQIRVDPGSPMRVVMMIQQLYENLESYPKTVLRVKKPPKHVKEDTSVTVSPSRKYRGIYIPPGMALCNGELVPEAFVREKLSKARK